MAEKQVFVFYFNEDDPPMLTVLPDKQAFLDYCKENEVEPRDLLSPDDFKGDSPVGTFAIEGVPLKLKPKKVVTEWEVGS